MDALLEEPSADHERDIDAVIRQVRQQIPDVIVTQLHKNRSNDDDHLWWFDLPEIQSGLQMEGASCPFFLETDEQSSQNALKPRTVAEAVTLIVTYLASVRAGHPISLPGQRYWEDDAE